MTRREQLLEVYKHKNTGYVPCFFTDMDFSKPAEINERPEQGGLDWFGVEWEFVPAVLAPMVKPGTKRLVDICNWKKELVFPDLDAIDPLQVKNPVRALKDKYQHRVTFVGGYNNQAVYDRPGVTEAEIREETRRTMQELAPGGSFVAFPLTVTFDFVPVFIDEHMKHAFSFGEQKKEG